MLAFAPAMATYASPFRTMSLRQESARILVVDDDPISASLEAHMLSLLGHAPTVQADPEHALILARSGRFDILLLDLDMPVLDGFQTLAALREQEAAAQARPLPVIAVTGFSSATDRERCRVAGFDDHISKPIAAGLLGATIERVQTARGQASFPLRNSDAERLRLTVERLGEVRPGDRVFAPTVIESFALRAAQLIEAMGRALESDDFEASGRAARALKSSAEFLGAMGLAGLCGETAGFCERANGGGAREALCRVDHEHQAVLTLLLSNRHRL